MFQSDLLNLEGGEGSGPAVLGSFSVGVEGGMGLDGMGMGLEERVAVGMERMAERMAELEARVEELEAQLSVKGATVVAAVSTPVKTVVNRVTEKTAPPAPVKTVAKKEKTAAAPVAAVPIPLDAPTPASYRLAAELVSAHTKCQARRLKPTAEDKRYKPSVFAESLCTGEVEAGTDGLCSTCNRWKDDPKKWNGLITEEPLATTHMLGTAWAAKCKWTASGSGSAPVSSAASVASVEESGPGQTPAPVSAATVAPMEVAAKKVRAPRKKKEAVATTAAVATAAVTLGTAVVTPATVAAATSTTEPVADAGELKLLQGEFYWVVGSNVYEYDQIEEKPGDYVGRVRADETIDGDAEEEGAVESDGE